ncbi:MAG: hypothetical protein IJ008_03505 [Clostridia bacterium]|nr:hypothetical protein [Clostridia bacterium]
MAVKQINELELIEVRKKIGLYSIKELCLMFKIGRESIDYALNTNRLKYISPNNRDRYIYLKDYLKYVESL